MDAPRVAGRSENPDNVRLVRDVLARPLLQTKALSRLAGIELDVFGSYFAEQLIGPPRDHHTLTICLGYSPFIEQTHGGQSRSGQAFAGEAHILPAGAGSRWQGTAPEHLSVRFQPGALGELNREADLSRSRVMNVTHALCIRDPSFRHFAALCRQELSKPSHPVQSLLIDSLASALALHFVRSYATGNCRGVDPQPTGDVRSIRRVLDYVEAEQGRSFSLAELSAIAGVSRYHFSRIFKQHVGMTPARYVESSRIEYAKRLLRSGALSLVDVSLASGFLDQSHFTRRFRHYAGCTPGQFVRDNARVTRPRV